MFQQLYAVANATHTGFYAFENLSITMFSFVAGSGCSRNLSCRTQILRRYECEGTMKINNFGFVDVGVV